MSIFADGRNDGEIAVFFPPVKVVQDCIQALDSPLLLYEVMI